MIYNSSSSKDFVAPCILHTNIWLAGDINQISRYATTCLISTCRRRRIWALYVLITTSLYHQQPPIF